MRAQLLTWTVSLGVILVSVPSSAASLRCGNQLVSDGDSKLEVEMKCGPPAAKDSRTESQSVFERGAVRTIVKTIDEWTYNFGSTQLMQVVVFENGKVTDVKSAGRGK